MWVRTTEYVPIPGRVTAHEGECAFTTPLDGERGFEVRRVERDRHLLVLWGRFGGRWVAPLCRGLARAGLEIRRGDALRLGGDSTGAWHVRLEIERSDPSTDPVLIDYLALLARGRSQAAAPLEISDYALSESSAHGGSLLLEVRGSDRAPALGGTLARAAFLALTPVELRLDAAPGGVRDQLWLRTRDGELPTPRARKLLAEALDGRLLR